MDRLVKNISDNLWKLADSPNIDKDVIEFGVYYVLLYTSTIGLLFIFASLFDVLPQALLAAAGACVLRNFSGGSHFESPGVCIILSALVYPTFALLAGIWPEQFNFLTILIIDILGLTAIIRYSPAESESKPLSTDQKKSLRLWSLIAIGIWIFASLILTKNATLIAVAFGIGWQCFSVTPVCQRLYAGVDTITGLILRKRCIS